MILEEAIVACMDKVLPVCYETCKFRSVFTAAPPPYIQVMLYPNFGRTPLSGPMIVAVFLSLFREIFG
jgi:hypothetical protein